MAGVLLLNVLDVARALGSAPTKATPEDVANWLLTEYVPRRGGGFNYNSAINATFDMFRGASSIDAAVLYCLTTGNPKGRRQNAEAIKCVAGYAIRNISKCYRIGFTAVAVGRIKGETVYIGIKAPMVRAYEKDIFRSDAGLFECLIAQWNQKLMSPVQSLSLTLVETILRTPTSSISTRGQA